jgi:hypothetical protein
MNDSQGRDADDGDDDASAAVQFGRSEFDPWESAPTIKARFPDLSGAPLMAKLRAIYLMPEKQTLAFYTASGKPALKRHPKNPRDQHSSREQYKSLVIANGVIDGGRSELMAVLGQEGGEQVAYFVAGATLVEACYEAFDSGSKSVPMEFTKKRGLNFVSLVDARSPDDVIGELVESMNGLNGIAGKTSFVELLDKAPALEKGWLEKRRDDRKRRKVGQSEVAEDNRAGGDVDAAGSESYDVEYRKWFMANHSKTFNSNFGWYKEQSVPVAIVSPQLDIRKTINRNKSG